MRNGINKRFVIFLCAFLHNVVHAQDSLKVLQKEAFIEIIKKYHPVLKQAALDVDIAQSKITQARGAFDPSANGNWDTKTFESKEYYNYRGAYLSIPTWYGVEVKTGIEDITGQRVSTEATIGTIAYAGVQLTANEFIFDKRRAILKQAKAYRQMSRAEQLQTINDLLYEGISAYWDWLRDYLLYQVISRAVRNNEQRLRLIRIEYDQGGRPAIDTTEALAQLQTFYLQQSEAWLKLNNSGLKLSNYLWLESDQPFRWDNEILPDTNNLPSHTIDLPSLTMLLDTIARHPKLQMIEKKMDILAIENLLARQSFIPKLSISGNVLSRNFDLLTTGGSSFIGNNHKATINLSIPLLQRYARGKFRETKLLMAQTNLEQNNIELQLQNKVRMTYNELLTLQSQVTTSISAFNNYNTLFLGEQTKFGLGESSLFLLNSRENKWLEAKQKLIELEIKFHQKKVAVLWAAGILR